MLEHFAELAERRHFLEAGTARFRPKIQDHDAAAVVAEPELAAGDRGQLEIGREAISRGVVRSHGAKRGARSTPFAIAGRRHESVNRDGREHDHDELRNGRRFHDTTIAVSG
jgi:hypothetical protein